MANVTIDGMTDGLTTVNSADEVPIWDVSAVATKKVTRAILLTAEASDSIALTGNGGSVTVNSSGAVVVAPTAGQATSISAGNLQLATDAALLQMGAAQDVALARDAANALAHRNGTSAQTLRVYNTFTSSAIGEWFQITWSGNVCTVQVTNNGTGLARDLECYSGIGKHFYLGCGTSKYLGLGDTAYAGFWNIDNTNGDLVGGANNTYSLGNATRRVKNLYLGTGIAHYQSVATAGWGVPAIYASGRSTAQTGAVASVTTYTVGAADGSFLVSANVNVTTSTTHSFTVTVTYTDETNTARTLTLSFSQLAGTLVQTITNATGAGPYEGVPVRLRCKAATAITVVTSGTFTTVTYNVEASITQVA